MNQNELNRAVARATGETVSAVKRIGFMIMDPAQPVEDPTDPVHGGRAIDWDDFERFQQQHAEAKDELDLVYC